MTKPTPGTTTLRIQGRKLESRPLPQLLQRSTRSVTTGETKSSQAYNALLPPDLIQVDEVLDVSVSARAVDAPGVAVHDLELAAGQVLLLELADGTTLITHAAQFRETLQRLDPDALDDQGRVLISTALSNRGAFAAPDRSLGDVVQGLKGILSKVFKITLKRAADDLLDQARGLAGQWLSEKGKDKLQELAEFGLSWYGTKALMRLIENRIGPVPGLHRWTEHGLGELIRAGDAQLQNDAAEGPLLVFIHGTGSSTLGSFSDLRAPGSPLPGLIDPQYGTRVYALEHYTFSDSPIDNALQLAQVLPRNARVHLVTHSRGGLVGDLLCLDSFQDLIDSYATDKILVAETDPADRARLLDQIKEAHAEQREALQKLEQELQAKQLRVERYVRVACPARGTLLASGNFDVFLSVLLKLVGLVPWFQGQPLYAAVERVVLEIASNRTRPNLVPGIEAMLPESALARFLLRARPRAGLRLGVIAGDLEGSGLKWLAALFADRVFFDRQDNDLVVDTASMYEGVARAAQGQRLTDVLDESHFGYFRNADARKALCDWLGAKEDKDTAQFEVIRGIRFEPTREQDIEQIRREAIGIQRSATDVQKLPLVIVLPGVMGSHLWRKGKDRIWLDPGDLVLGKIDDIAWGKPHIEAEQLVSMSYSDLCKHLRKSHEVLTFPYDWRQPLDVLADHFGSRLKEALAASAPERPIRILAHSMGGLVVRALIHTDRPLWDTVMSRAGARFVMLGTPNQGSFSMVENLTGKADMIRMLSRADLDHDLQQLLDIVAGFRGAVQLLPRKGFVDTSGLTTPDYFVPSTWQSLKNEMKDRWFGDGVCALPTAEALTEANWLWQQDGDAPALPAEHQDKTVYVFGHADKTACGIRKEGDQWKMLATPEGDGTVTWRSGDIPGIGQRYYMPTPHGDLANDEDYFDSLTSLLESGSPGKLKSEPPKRRGASSRAVLSYDAGPVRYPTADDLLAGVFGGARKPRERRHPGEVLKVRVRAMDLCNATQPVLVGHYDEDPIAGVEALIDRRMVQGELSVRDQLGLYPDRVGTAMVVLRTPNELERRRGHFCGAVVAGLGKYDGSLSTTELVAAARTGALRYLLALKEMREAQSDASAADSAGLCSVLLGYNSSVNLSIGDSIGALLDGVCEANRQFAAQTGSLLRIATLDIVELYLDTAISAAHALRRLAASFNDGRGKGTKIDASPTLDQAEGYRTRLEDARAAAYWPRLMISDASCPPECRPPSPENTGTAATAPGQSPVAEKLRFLMLGQRARAESVMQQRQPGLVESLVEAQIGDPRYDESFSRTLFQLLVPPDFKEAARQMSQMILVLDRYTADLPWELMQVDQQPLVTRVAMVRQLSTPEFRRRVKQTLTREAYVLGNPSSAGFGKVFADDEGTPYPDPPGLSGAEIEATRVADALSRHGMHVAKLIGTGVNTLNAINTLYERPYRILHIAAHGVHELAGKDGRLRSGVVLSDGQLLSAAEVGAMENVPDFVFLNCCHLGKTGTGAVPTPTAFNRFAYSLSRELIEMGVRAVIAAGWAVGDASAQHFAEVFYEALLAQRKSFGTAVLEARRSTFDQYPRDITWGAYQAYGDPGWSIDPRRVFDQDRASATFEPVAPEELIAELRRIGDGVRRRDQALLPAEAAGVDKDVRELLAKAPQAWLAHGAVLTTLGEIYGDMGPDHFATASAHYREAIRLRDKNGRVPVRAAEQLANLESRDGERYVLRSDGKTREDLTLIESAIHRLKHLNQTVDGVERSTTAANMPNEERCSLLGSAYKSLAAVHAASLLRGEADDRGPMIAALNESLSAYAHHASPLDRLDVNPHTTLNRLFLSALGATGERECVSLAQQARRCGAAASEAFGREPDFWNAIMTADAELVVALFDNALATVGAPGEEALNRLRQTYRCTLSGLQLRPKDMDSSLRQILLMARFYAAGASKLGKADAQRVAHRLLSLADELAPAAADMARQCLFVRHGGSRPAPAPDATTKSRPSVAKAEPGARRRKPARR